MTAANKKVEIFKVDYVINGRNEDWVATIAGFTSDDVIRYLEIFCRPNRVQVNSMTTLSKLDGVTDGARELIAQPILGREADPAGEVKQPEEDDSKPQKRAIVPKP